jgi:large subunit ribosomal protein L20
MRVKRGYTLRRKHKRLLDKAEGFRGRRKSSYKIAKRAVQKAMKSAYRDRRAKKRNFRMLWIARINAAARGQGLTYSRLIVSLEKANIQIDRKMLALLAYSDPTAFKAVVDKATQTLA